MRIAIDGQSIANIKSGLGIYTERLFHTLKTSDPNNDYVLIQKKQGSGERTYQRMFWENCILPFRAAKEGVDILHIPAFAAPLWKAGRWKTVITIHDLIGKLFPENLSFFSRFYWGKWLPLANRFGDCIIVDSECTKIDVIKYLKVDSEKVRVIYLAASDHFTNHKSQNEIERVCIKHRVKRPYLLFVGNIEPRKNLARVIRAFSNVRKKDKSELNLVIVGSKAWDYPNIHKLINELELSDSILCLNYVDDEDLVSLYNGGELLVFPSLYEGFGLPIVEAMQCGMPVLTSNLSSMPEVGGKAAYYVNPYEEREIEEGMRLILTDSQLQNELRAKGLIQAKQFSWKQTAEQTLAVYQELAQ